MLLIAIKIWLLGLSFAHILPKELLYLSFFGLVSYLSISTEPFFVFDLPLYDKIQD